MGTEMKRLCLISKIEYESRCSMKNDQVIQRRQPNFDNSSEAIVRVTTAYGEIADDFEVVFTVLFSTSF